MRGSTGRERVAKRQEDSAAERLAGSNSRLQGQTLWEERPKNQRLGGNEARSTTIGPGGVEAHEGQDKGLGLGVDRGEG